MACHCRCGQRVILTSFEPPAFQRRAARSRVSVLEADDKVACPRCGVSLAHIWQAYESAVLETVLSRLGPIGDDELIQFLAARLKAQQEKRLRCN